MYSHQLLMPDGRQLTLYSRFPIAEDIIATSPYRQPIQANLHLRWHPLRGEWVAYTNYQPAEDQGLIPLELPPGRYDIAVFDHYFPSRTLSAHNSFKCIVETIPANGACEIVVFTQNNQASLSSLELDHLDLLLAVWGDRTLVLGANPQIQYVLPFEHQGVEVDATLHQPHGQIYAYPFIPPIPTKMLEMQRRFYQEHQRSLLTDLIHKEIADNQRIIYQDEYAIAFVPVCARYPYEVWIAPIQPVSSLYGLNPQQRWGLAKALKTVTLKYAGLGDVLHSAGGELTSQRWRDRTLPYLMAWFQAPTDGKTHPEVHLHAEFYPPHYTTGSALAGGMFTNDCLPEEKAKELQAVIVNI